MLILLGVEESVMDERAKKVKKGILAGIVILSGILFCLSLILKMNLGENGTSLWGWIANAAICLIIALIVFFIVRRVDQLYGILADLWHSRKLILQLAKNDFKTRYAGSFMGIFWAFVQPVVIILIYWFVFEKGLRAGGQVVGNVNVPFVLFLISGMVPWFFFSDAWMNGTNSLTSYSYLVKKVVFKISILPIVKIISSIFVHFFFIGLAVVTFAINGFYPDLYTLQIFYYSFAMFVLVLGLSYISASLVVFIRDLSEIISILLQVLIWVTPIMWNIETAISSESIKQLFKLNPMYYIVNGYRSALIYKTWFWETPRLTAWFWFTALTLLGAGLLVFRRLKKHFADVL